LRRFLNINIKYNPAINFDQKSETMQRTVFSEAVRTIAAKITRDLEYRTWVAKALPTMGGGQRHMLVQAIEASGLSDPRLSKAMGAPMLEGARA